MDKFNLIAIDAQEAMDMIVNDDIKDLYYVCVDGSIDRVVKYNTNFDEIINKHYFKRVDTDDMDDYVEDKISERWELVADKVRNTYGFDVSVEDDISMDTINKMTFDEIQENWELIKKKIGTCNISVDDEY